MKQQTIEEARRRVAKMDTIDHEAGFASPATAFELVRTASLAIEAGCYAEAYVYLERVMQQMKSDD